MGIAKRRRQLGLSQSDLAKKLGVDQTAVHNWEKGKSMPATRRLPAIAEILNCTVDDLLADDGSDDPKDNAETD